MNEKLKHLEFIQGVINRLASNSFLLKAWTITLTSAIFALATKDSTARIIYIAYLPVVIFWFLDAYFLRQERLFRRVYESVRKKNNSEIDFSLDTTPFRREVSSYVRVMFSITLGWFYGVLLICVVIATILLTHCLAPAPNASTQEEKPRSAVIQQQR
jgi:hypothetical protein